METRNRKPMKLARALRLAISALHDAQKHLHFDANMYDLHGYDYPIAVSASRQRAELRDAITVLLGQLDLVSTGKPVADPLPGNHLATEERAASVMDPRP